MIIGIDLGTSTSEIAYINKEGLPEVIPNHLGEKITPSVVYIDENLKPIVGSPAIEKLFTEPENTFIEVKRLMGTNTTLIARNHSFTPVEISSFILKYLIECAENYLKQKVEQVVITVPAYFTDAQRRDTLTAGEMLGIKVERIINEPTAASLDYGINRREDCDYVLVYDFGGGTLDVTVLELFEGVIDVMASCGNNELGGKDFDDLLVKELISRFYTEYKIDISKDKRAMARLKNEAQQCKIALSSADEYQIDLPFLATKNNMPVGFSTTVTQEYFENMIKDMVKSTAKQINTALFDAKLEPKEVKLVLLVGGTTKIPYIKQFLSEELKLVPKNLVDPDLAVVKGAAIQAGIITDTFDEDALILLDVAPYSLSTEVLSRGVFGREIEVCDILIKRNTTIPVSVSKMYFTAADYQESVRITAYQGESRVPEENILLNSFLLSGIPVKRAGKESIEITFSYDLNGILVVSGEIVSTGKKMSVEIETSNAAGQIDTSKWNEFPIAKSYRTVLRKGEKLIKEDKLPPEALDQIKYLTEEIKKGIVLSWDRDLLDNRKKELLELYSDWS